MDNNTFSVNFIATRGNRCSASLLSWLENNVYEFLPANLQVQTRTQILDHVNDLKNAAIDVIKSDTTFINDYYVDALSDIRKDLKDLLKNGRHSQNEN